MTPEQEHKIAEEFGAKCLPDVARGTPWERFEIGEWSIWWCSKGWACAKKEGNLLTNHLYYETLREALLVCRDKSDQKLILAERQRILQSFKKFAEELKDKEVVRSIQNLCNELS